MRRCPLPPELGSQFSTSAALTKGVHPKRLGAGDVTAPFRGMRARDEIATFSDLARAALAVLPPQALFSHLTAARLMGMPLPMVRQAQEALHFTVPRNRSRWRHEGFVEHHGDRTPATSAGLPVVAVAETWVDLAAIVTLTDLVIAGDYVLHEGLCSKAGLVTAVSGRRGARGIRKCVSALPQLRAGSASPMETRARLIFQQWGLPEPELNVDVFDVHGGWIARVDFLWRTAGVVGEYYGAVHGDSWTGDLTRSAQLEDAGYRVAVMTSRDLGVGAGDLRARLTRLLGC